MLMDDSYRKEMSYLTGLIERATILLVVITGAIVFLIVMGTNDPVTGVNIAMDWFVAWVLTLAPTSLVDLFILFLSLAIGSLVGFDKYDPRLTRGIFVAVFLYVGFSFLVTLVTSAG